MVDGNQEDGALAPDRHTTGSRAALRRPGGEFRDRALETVFRHAQATENLRHARILLVASAILNTLFLTSDWRFFGTPHFAVAIPARLFVVAAAIVALIALYRYRTPAHRERVMIGWMLANGLGVGVLVSSHSDIAMFVLSMLPIVYYLAVPVSFGWRILGGAGCSLAMVAGYGSGVRSETISLGLALAMLILNVALVLVVGRSNRLERLEWLATRAERRTSAELAASRERVEKMFAASPVPMIVTARDNGEILRINDAARSFIGSDIADIGDIYIDGADRRHILEQLDAVGLVRDYEIRVRSGDGTARTVLVNATMLELSSGRHIISGIIDISDRKAVERDLEWLATTDTLTGLPNRLSFFAAGRAEMLRARRTGAPLALLMIDLDEFKQVNDSFGHQGGDEALRSFASICRSVAGQGQMAARLGGEEFGILLRNTDIDTAADLAERLRSAVQHHSIETRRGTIRITLSIGIAMVDQQDADLDPALARADAALYAAKDGGRNRVSITGRVAAPAPQSC
ncbi:MAG: putative diguanylate cyclase [Sphingomonas bacterium]|nr:sensor domain-containing diguanylate cyclase [Sphingomonas bacterium]MDB5690759.1 putative diguanylate cyclase [Sphingomonas bacterium]